MRQEGFVYFIRGGDGLIKIGRTGNIEQRLETIRAHNPRAKVVAAVKGGSRLEAFLHRRYRPFHFAGEWFRPGHQLARVVELLGLPEEQRPTRARTVARLLRMMRKELHA